MVATAAHTDTGIEDTMTPPPAARWQHKLRVVVAALWGMARALARRLVGRSVNPRWPLGLELVVAATRGTWSTMPRIGMVPWRNVGEALSPLRTGGLPPRFVNLRSSSEPPLRGAWLEPQGAGPGVILYLHGGGFVFGSLRTHGELVGALARAAHARAFALAYRLAPEHPAPAAIDDAVDAYRALLAQGIAPEHIAIAGDSAGGTLTLNTLLSLRDAGLPLPAAAVAISPRVDLTCSGQSFDDNAAYDFVGKEHSQMAARHYAAGQDPSSPALSPLFATLSGLPPLLVQAGALETLVDQIRAFTSKARGDGAPLTYAEYPDMVHVWHLLARFTPAGTRAVDEAGAFIRAHTEGRGTATP